MNGQILPGRALTIRELAALLDVSPMPIREALRQLSAESALEIQGNRRVMVPTMTAMKFTELCEARIAIESHAAARALPYIDATRLAELHSLDRLIDQAQEDGNLEQISILNQNFHRFAIEKQDAFALQLAITADIREGIAFAGTPELLHRFIEQSRTASHA